MKKNYNKILIIVALTFLFTLVPSSLQAQETTNSGYIKYPSGWEVIPEECLDPNTTVRMTVQEVRNGQTVSVEKDVIKKCDANSFIQLFVNLAYIMLKLGPPLAMIIIIYGGFWFLTARGKQEKVQTGKKILSSAFLGLAVIVFIGWTATFFIIQALTGGFQEGESSLLFNDVANIASREWWEGGAPEELNNQGGQQDTYLVCCVINGIGCKMSTEPECDAINNYWQVEHPSPYNAFSDPNVSNCSENTTCQTYENNVNNDEWQCCISYTEVTPARCYEPNSRGCADFRGYIPFGARCNQIPDMCTP